MQNGHIIYFNIKCFVSTPNTEVTRIGAENWPDTASSSADRHWNRSRNTYGCADGPEIFCELRVAMMNYGSMLVRNRAGRIKQSHGDVIVEPIREERGTYLVGNNSLVIARRPEIACNCCFDILPRLPPTPDEYSRIREEVVNLRDARCDVHLRRLDRGKL